MQREIFLKCFITIGSYWLTSLLHYVFIYYTNGSTLEGLSLLRKTVSTHVKNYANFSRVFEITSSLRSLVRYPVGHSKRNSISPRTHVLSLFPQLLQSWQLFQVVLPKSGFSSTKCRPTRSAAETLVLTEKKKPLEGQNKELTEVFLEMWHDGGNIGKVRIKSLNWSRTIPIVNQHGLLRKVKLKAQEFWQH